MSALGATSRLLAAGLCLIVLSVCWVGSASAVVVTLDAGTVPPDVQCNETWTEAGVVLSFVPTTDEDCTVGACFFGLDDPDGVWLYPCRLNADLSGLAGTVVSAEVDVIDYCGVGCTKAFLYEGATTVDSASNTLIGTPETLNLAAGVAVVDRMAVSSCEGAVTEIRITVESSPVESMSWGRIRSLYR